MCSRIPAAKNPEMMFEIVLPACQIAIRVGFSSLVYQEDVTIASQWAKPRLHRKHTKRNAWKEWGLCQTNQESDNTESSPADILISIWINKVGQQIAYEVIAGMQIVQILQAIIIPGNSLLGFALASQRLPGSWPIRYPT